jgi:hypothetical protein
MSPVVVDDNDDSEYHDDDEEEDVVSLRFCSMLRTHRMHCPKNNVCTTT